MKIGLDKKDDGIVDDGNGKPSFLGSVGVFYNVSGMLVGSVVVALLFGIWLDKEFGTEPIFMVSFVLAAFVVSMIDIVHKVKNIDEN
ncbi:MAG: AtpZ/AtpI family protein [Candidatus Paceibacterota bacterium]|jgi:F0F1-type ATP synthase assembly protein I